MIPVCCRLLVGVLLCASLVSSLYDTTYYNDGTSTDITYYTVYRIHQFPQVLSNTNAASVFGEIGFVASQYGYTTGVITQDCIISANLSFAAYSCCNANSCSGCNYYSGSNHAATKQTVGRCYQIYPPSDAPCYAYQNSVCNGVPGESCLGDCVGFWYSFPSDGMCADADPIGTNGCTWKAAPTIASINYADLLTDGFLSCRTGSAKCTGNLDWKSLNVNADLIRNRFTEHGEVLKYNAVTSQFDKKSVRAIPDPAWQCRAPCPAGSFSASGFLDGTNDCQLCPIGSYSANKASTSCTSCGSGRTTTSAGSISRNQCLRNAQYSSAYADFSSMASLPSQVMDLPQAFSQLLTSSTSSSLARYCLSRLDISAADYTLGGGNVADLATVTTMQLGHTTSLPASGMCSSVQVIGGFNQCTWKLGSVVQVISTTSLNLASMSPTDLDNLFASSAADTYMWDGSTFRAAQNGLYSSPQHQCESLCPSGSYSSDGFAHGVAGCTLCPADSFSNTTGSTSCYPCADFHTTKGLTGASSSSQCSLMPTRSEKILAPFTNAQSAKLSGNNAADRDSIAGLASSRWYVASGIVAEFCVNDVNTTYGTYNYCYGSCCSSWSPCSKTIGRAANPYMPTGASSTSSSNYGYVYSFPESYECTDGQTIGDNGCSFKVAQVVRAVDFDFLFSRGFTSCNIANHHPPTTTTSPWCWGLNVQNYDQNTQALKDAFAFNSTAYVLITTKSPFSYYPQTQAIPIGHDVVFDTDHSCAILCPAGMYSSTGQYVYQVEDCKPCPVGTYNDQPGATSCKKCSITSSSASSVLIGASSCGSSSSSSSSTASSMLASAEFPNHKISAASSTTTTTTPKNNNIILGSSVGGAIILCVAVVIVIIRVKQRFGTSNPPQQLA